MNIKTNWMTFYYSECIKLHSINPLSAQTSLVSNLSNFFVCADFVEHSALGGQQVQMLKYFAAPEMEHNNRRLDVDFNNNTYVKLSKKNFDRIHIRILSAADGRLLKSNSNSPSLLQLLFVNTGTTSI